jgi:co-chaperonin GroES (HSP10)
MKVLHDNVLVTQDTTKEKTTASGLILSAEATTGHRPAIVVAVGDGIEDIQPGNKVYLDWTKGLPVELDGVQCAVVEYKEVRLVVSE